MNIIYLLLRYYLILIAFFFTSRTVLLLIHLDRLNTQEYTNLWLSFLYGLKMDTITVCVFLIIPLLILTFIPNNFSKIKESFFKYYFLFIFIVTIFIEIATYPFMQQFDARPNYLFLEYLIYPKEIINMILSSHLLIVLFCTVLIILFTKSYQRYFSKLYLDTSHIHFIKRLLIFIPLLIILFLGIRSSLGHRPANISDAMFSPNRLLNEITLNSVYSVSYALYSQLKHNADGIKSDYGKIDIDEAILRVQKRLNITNTDPKYVLTRNESSHFKTNTTKNIVIFIQESLGAQFVGALGGTKGITPNLDKLSQEGILFEKLYSNGIRSVRGLAGLTSGNFSIPGEGVVKRNKSQKDFFTLATLLKPLDYDLSFIYGGEARFDNMKSWYLGNGFNKVIEEKDFKNTTFKGTWGVCDEDLVNKANEYFKDLYAQNKKFASVIFSSSNHLPFEFPKEKIELFDKENPNSVENAIKYADFAIGKFIEKAKKQPYYKDTIFAIVADHNVRVYGNDVVPINMFQIPGLILGENVKAQKYSRLTSQPDILATVLDLAGIDGAYPIMGHSIYNDKKQELSFMKFNDTYVLRIKNNVAIIQPNKLAQTYTYKENKLILTTHNEDLELDLLSFIHLLNHVYQHQLYK